MKKITIHSAFSKQALKAIDKIIKPDFILRNPGATTDSEEIMMPYPAFNFSGKTKYEYHLNVSDEEASILGMMNYSMYANLDRISDFALYRILHPHERSETITYPMDESDKITLSSEIAFNQFQKLTENARKRALKSKDID